MRGSFAAPLFAAVAVTSLVTLVTLVPREARAEGADLPSGNELPRVVPLGVVDTYYAAHFRAPFGREATLMTTAVRSQEFQVNLAAIGVRLEHAKLLGTVVLQAGTSVDALYPPLPAGTAGSHPPLSAPEVWKHIQVANVGYRMGDLTVEAGLMPSHIGYEGYVSTTNWAYTRAMVSDLTPYFVAGVKATYRLSPALSVALLGYNGWNQALYDNNRTPSGGLKVEWQPTGWLTVSDAVHVGPERSQGDDLRLFDDLIVQLRLPSLKLSLALEAWGGMDKPKNGDAPAPYYGGALWARYQLSETIYAALRGEIVRDKDGVLTQSGARLTDLGGGQDLYGGTLTLGWQPHPSLLVRAEMLHRRASRYYFQGDNGESAECNFAARFFSCTDAQGAAHKESTTIVGSVALSF